MNNSKFLITVLVGISISTSALATQQKTYVFASGGMGTDGASLMPVPVETSVEDSIAIYNALNVRPNKKGVKKVGLRYQGDTVGIECEKPSEGIHTLTAGCKFITILKEKAPKEEVSISVGTIELAPASSDAIFNALDIENNSGRVGASVKKVGNLTCTKVVYPGAKAKCILSNVTIAKMAIDNFRPGDRADLLAVAKRLGL